MKILFLLLFTPILLFSQDIGLSLENQLLFNNAKQNKTSLFPKPTKKSGFNLGITSRFEGGIVSSGINHQDLNLGLFNMTSLEFYFPSLRPTSTTRFLATFRFSTPILATVLNTSLYVPRLGFGLGMSTTFFDGRSQNGIGLTSSINFLAGMDFDFLDIIPEYFFVNEFQGIVRFDFGIRWNYFVSKRFAFVFGVDLGSGFSIHTYRPNLGEDGFPVEPLTHIGTVYSGIFNFGATVGFMF